MNRSVEDEEPPAADDATSHASADSNETSTISESLISSVRQLTTQLKYSQALDSYKEVVSFNIAYANTVFEKGIEAAKQRNFKKAIDYIDMAIAIVPESDYYISNKGVSYHNMNKFQEAIECYDRALLINPHNAITFNFKGIVG